MLSFELRKGSVLISVIPLQALKRKIPRMNFLKADFICW